MVRVTRYLTVNPAHVSTLWIDDVYSNPSRLVICMADGREHVVRHAPQYLGGDDIYKIKAAIEAAMERGNATSD